MKKLMRVIGLMAMIILLASSLGLTYDQTRPTGKIFDTKDTNTILSYVQIKAYGLATGLLYDNKTERFFTKQGHWFQSGSGVVVSEGMIFTAAHVINPETIDLTESHLITQRVDTLRLDYRVVMIQAYLESNIVGHVLYEHVDSDLAVIAYFHEKNTWMRPIPYPVEFEKEPINTHDVVCAVVHTRDKDGALTGEIRVKWGTIVHPGAFCPNPAVLPWLSIWTITLNIVIQPGDSGSPLYVFRDGKPVLIGIIVAIWNGHYLHYSYAMTLPYVTRLMRMQE